MIYHGTLLRTIDSYHVIKIKIYVFCEKNVFGFHFSTTVVICCHKNVKILNKLMYFIKIIFYPNFHFSLSLFHTNPFPTYITYILYRILEDGYKSLTLNACSNKYVTYRLPSKYLIKGRQSSNLTSHIAAHSPTLVVITRL